jgi:hypothetical protein
LLEAHRQTQSASVRKWVTQMFAEVLAEGEEIYRMVEEALVPECAYLPTLLYYIHTKGHRLPHLKDKVKALYQHPDEEVRWRVALVLDRMPLTHAEDAPCLRALAVDSYYATRLHACIAYSRIGARAPEDLAAMKQVVEMDDGAAKVYAQGMIYAWS